jgi:hypothetical protein
MKILEVDCVVTYFHAKVQVPIADEDTFNSVLGRAYSILEAKIKSSARDLIDHNAEITVKVKNEDPGN